MYTSLLSIIFFSFLILPDSTFLFLITSICWAYFTVMSFSFLLWCFALFFQIIFMFLGEYCKWINLIVVPITNMKYTHTVLIHKSHKTNVKVSVNYTYRGSSQSLQHTTFAIRPKSINHYLSYCTGNQFIFGQFCVERVINNINTFNHLH